MRSLSLTPGGAPAPASLATGAPAPDRIAIWFDGVLDDSFVMIRDLQLPNAPTSVDMLVLGPPGVWALYVESDPGQYRAQGRDFYAWNSAAGGYVLLAPNPLEHLLLNQAQLRGWLNAAGLPPDSVRSAILFTDPAARVETVDSEIELVGPQQIEGYPMQIARLPAALDKSAADRILHALASGELPASAAPLPRNESRPPAARSPLLALKRNQLVLLAVFAVLDLCVIAGACVLVIWPIFQP